MPTYFTTSVIFGDGSTKNIRWVEVDTAIYIPLHAVAEIIAALPAGSNIIGKVQIVDSAASEIETIGGGVQYTEGATAAAPTGTAAMWKGAGDALQSISMATPLPVQPGTSTEWASNLAKLAGTAVSVNSGTKDAGTQRVVLATDQPALTTPMPAAIKPATSGGTSVHSRVSTADTNAVNVKATPGQVYSLFVTNNGTSARYLKLYNDAGTPDETDTPIFRAMIPAGGGIHPKFPLGLACGAGIAFRLTAEAADSNTGAIAADECLINVEYN